MDSNIFSIIMLIMGIALLLYAGIAYISGDTILLNKDTYSIPKGKKEKPHARKLAKIIAIIGLSFLASSIVGLTEVYWLAVVVLIGGFVVSGIVGSKIMKY